MNRHRREHEIDDEYTACGILPCFRQRWKSCVICGEEFMSTLSVLDHITQIHNEQEKEKFGFAETSRI